MGIKHANLISEYLSSQKEPIAKSRIRSDLKLNYEIFLESFNFLLTNKVIEQIIIEDKPKYRLKGGTR